MGFCETIIMGNGFGEGIPHRNVKREVMSFRRGVSRAHEMNSGVEEHRVEIAVRRAHLESALTMIGR